MQAASVLQDHGQICNLPPAGHPPPPLPPAEGTFLNMGFKPDTGVFTNRALIGPHHSSIKYSSNESTVFIEKRGFLMKTKVMVYICNFFFSRKHEEKKECEQIFRIFFARVSKHKISV